MFAVVIGLPESYFLYLSLCSLISSDAVPWFLAHTY